MRVSRFSSGLGSDTVFLKLISVLTLDAVVIGWSGSESPEKITIFIIYIRDIRVLIHEAMTKDHFCIFNWLLRGCARLQNNIACVITQCCVLELIEDEFVMVAWYCTRCVITE